MADLNAVLRKTIDGLPSATPQLRAKVYEKARAAIERQIAAANPPLSPEIVEARHRALEEAIASTESHYTGASDAPEPDVAPEPAPPPASPATAVPPAAPIPSRDEPAPQVPVARDEPFPHAAQVERFEPVVAPSSVERSHETTRPAETVASPLERPGPFGRSEPLPGERPAPPPQSTRFEDEGAVSAADSRVGEVGPLSAQASVQALDNAGPVSGSDSDAGGMPRAEREADRDRFDFAAAADEPATEFAPPRYVPRAERSSRKPLAAAAVSLLLLGGAGALAYLYTDEIRGVLLGGQTETVATGETPPAQTTTEGAAPEPAVGTAAVDPAAPEGGPAAAQTAAPPPPAVAEGERRFTQRLMPDGTETDPGPAADTAANAFDEGTDVAAASLIPQEEEAQTSPPASAAETPPAETAAAAQAGDPSAIPVGQRAVFYEERSAEAPGSQRGGNVVWSVVSEPPGDGQPPEPAIRGVVEVPEKNMRLTMTIRRNGDATLPASHVIELLFDLPSDFEGGEIANVQRLALKPTEQARGEPLIGVAGRISDGFFIIALNDLQQAVQGNLDLLNREEWIDIPLAYSTGQRALMSLEKGIPGERVFREALDAWAART